jgi:chemosensory pili system protein ChpA (sensor histidine kinase/response regulator)
MGDGSVIPIINPGEFFFSTGQIYVDEVITQKESDVQETVKVLVVDDSVSVRKVVTRLMQSQGWEAYPAKDGIDALEKIGDTRPDIIVLDIEMPRMNGYELLSALKAQKEYEDIPVVILTSRSSYKHREKAISLGANGFVVKPYHDDEFINLIIELTAGRSNPPAITGGLSDSGGSGIESAVSHFSW